MRSLGLGACGILLAALCIPAGAALAPEDGTNAGNNASPTPDPFPKSTQLATRTLADPAISELSGLAASRLHPGVLYGVNDSGSGPIVYAIDGNGNTLARLTLDGATARDWEAMAPGWDSDGTPVLWVGDIGDNKGNQEHVRLYKITEPQQLTDQTVDYQSYWVSYPDGPHNAEALVFNQQDGTLSIATKSQQGPGRLFQLPAVLSTRRDNVAQPVLDVPQSITDGGWELSPTGQPRLVLIDYWSIHTRTSDGGWRSELGPLQLQREALAWPWLSPGVANDEVLLGSEGSGSKIVTAGVP